MKKIIIEGNKELKGTINISGAKNSAVALIPASILGKGPRAAGPAWARVRGVWCFFLCLFFWLPRKITIAVIGGAGNGAQAQCLGLIVASARQFFWPGTVCALQSDGANCGPTTCTWWDSVRSPLCGGG